MTTLSAGASVTLGVGDGGYLKIATSGGIASVTVTPTGGSASTVNLGPLPVRQTFGPYAEGASIALSNSTAVLDYDYSGGDGPSLTASQVAAVLTASPQRYAIGLGLLGDSITNNGYYTDAASPDGATVSSYWVSGATNNNARAMGWSTWVGPMSMQRIQVVKSWARQTNGVLAAGSNPVGWPLSAQVTQMLADPAYAQVDRVVIMIGTNDTAFGLAAWTAELLAQIARIGRPVDLITPPPRNDATATTVGGDSLRGWAWLQQARLILKRIAEASGGWVRYIDAYSKVNSPTTTPDVLPAANVLPDTIHPSNVGAYLIADAYVSATLPDSLSGDLDIWPNSSSAASTGAALLDQGFTNPVFATTTGGTGTWTIASGLTVTNIGSATHIGSSVASASGIGNAQRIAITNSAAGDGVDITTSSVHASGGTFLTAGDEAFAQVMVTINSGGIYPRNLFTRLTYFNGTNYLSLLFEVPSTAGDEKALPLTATRSFLLRTPKFIVPAGAAASSVTVKMRPTFAGAGACSIDIANLEVRRIRSGGVYA